MKTSLKGERIVMAEKQEVFEEFESLSAVAEAKCANVNGVMASISPIKKGKRVAI